MFMPNDVYSLSSQRIRVLWSSGQVIIWINIDDDRALPKRSTKNEFEHLMASKELKRIKDPFISISLNPPVAGSPSELIQEKAWEAIKDKVAQEPEIYQRQLRGRFISEIIKASGATKQTIYRWLRRYWQYGMCKNALSGRFEECGNAGQAKNWGKKKTGAPRSRSLGTGINVNKQVQALFRVAIEKCLLHEGKYEFDYAYNQVLIAFGVSLPCKPEDLVDVPTERQFRYFYENQYSSIEVTKKRMGAINYLKDFRPVLGTSTAEVAGPGSRYQIDATIADVYLVSEQDRSKIIGRPTLYFVVDVFSRAIVGMYIGLENPSWVGAMFALANAMLDKVSYCAEFDIKITDDRWPTVGLPEAILGDRGEMLSRHVEVLSKAFNINIENTAPYRADLKGIVERYFKTIQGKMKPFVEGYVTGKSIGKKRHGKDYRQDAIHTLKEFTQMIIRIVLHYNNDHIISTYDPDAEIPPDLPFQPLVLWNWGIQYRTGRLRRPDPDLVRINLMPHTEALVTEFGLKLFSCYYSCKEALNWGWFERNYAGPRKVTVAYDMHSANSIYLRPTDSYADYIEAGLTERSRACRDLTIWEVWEINDTRASAAASSRLKKRAGSVNLVNDLDEIAKISKQAQSKLPRTTKAEKIKGITANKQAERQYERKKRVVGNGYADDESSNVISLQDYQEERKSFRLPSNLEELLHGEQDNE